MNWVPAFAGTTKQTYSALPLQQFSCVKSGRFEDRDD
jgi:hypothetical protein